MFNHDIFTELILRSMLLLRNVLDVLGFSLLSLVLLTFCGVEQLTLLAWFKVTCLIRDCNVLLIQNVEHITCL